MSSPCHLYTTCSQGLPSFLPLQTIERRQALGRKLSPTLYIFKGNLISEVTVPNYWFSLFRSLHSQWQAHLWFTKNSHSTFQVHNREKDDVITRPLPRTWIIWTICWPGSNEVKETIWISVSQSKTFNSLWYKPEYFNTIIILFRFCDNLSIYVVTVTIINGKQGCVHNWPNNNRERDSLEILYLVQKDFQNYLPCMKIKITVDIFYGTWCKAMIWVHCPSFPRDLLFGIWLSCWYHNSFSLWSFQHTGTVIDLFWDIFEMWVAKTSGKTTML